MSLKLRINGWGEEYFRDISNQITAAFVGSLKYMKNLIIDGLF